MDHFPPKFRTKTRVPITTSIRWYSGGSNKCSKTRKRSKREEEVKLSLKKLSFFHRCDCTNRMSERI